MWKMSFGRNDDGSLRDCDFNHDFLIKGAFLTLDELRQILYALGSHRYHHYNDSYIDIEKEIATLLRQEDNNELEEKGNE